jgi:hypothetical protein
LPHPPLFNDNNGIAVGGAQITIRRNTLNISSGTAITIGLPSPITGTTSSTFITSNTINLESGNSSIATTQGIVVSQGDGVTINNNVLNAHTFYGNAIPEANTAINIRSSTGVSVNNNTLVGLYGFAITLAGANVTGDNNLYSPTYISRFYHGTRYCSSGTSTGSINFIDVGHCP